MALHINDQLAQLYNLEKELITQRTNFKNYVNTEIMLMQNQAKYKTTLEELGNINDNRKVYQPIGKAFIIRNKEEYIKDLKFLIEKCDKDISETSKIKEHAGKKLKECERNVMELTKSMSLLKAN